MKAIGFSFGMALLAALSWPSMAHAHAVLLGSSPEANQQIDVSPEQIELRFNENVGPVFFRVLDRTGEAAGEPAEIRIEGNNLLLPLTGGLPQGTYVISYRVISADTHPVGGSFAFGVGEPVSAGTESVSGGEASIWVIPNFVNRLVLYASVLLALGSALLLLLMEWPAGSGAGVRNQGRWAAAIAAISFVLAVAIGGADIVAGGGGALFSGATWSAGFASTFGVSALLGVPGALLAFWAFRQREAWPLWGAAALLVASFLVTGHAATAAPVWLAATSVGLHLIAAGFWFAALRPLIATTRELSAPAAGRVMDQFSSRAIWLVGGLLVAGVTISWIQVRSIGMLVTTQYGQQLLIKIGLVLFVLVLALYNKQRLTPALLRDEPGAAARIRRSIGIESVAILLVIALAASLTLPTPPRALADQAAMGTASMASAEGFRQTWTSGSYSVDVEITPAKPGANMVMLRFSTTAGNPVAMQSATLNASLPAASLEGIESEGEAMPPDMFHFMMSDLIIPGEWRISIDAFVDDFDKITFEGTVPLK